MRPRLPITIAATALFALAVSVVVVMVAIAAPASHTRAPARTKASAASAKPYSIKVSYDQTNQGMDRGGAIHGITGHGSFSAKLGAKAAFAAAVVALATGVPITKIAKGGTYVIQDSISARGAISGYAVAKFRAAGLGSICLHWAAKEGKFVPGMSFIPVSGTVTTAGGTGAAAKWQGSASFTQTNVTGATIENFFGDGKLTKLTTGGTRKLTGACKTVSKLH